MFWSAAVNDFWFQALSPQDWFAGGATLDARVMARFQNLYEVLTQHPPAPAELAGLEHLAAVIVFDQFPRNMFRGTANAFATDDLALGYTQHALQHKCDDTLAPTQKQFLYMPLMHSEDKTMQAESLARFQALGLADELKYAEQHKEVIDRFGRFPQRNAALGRASTEAERQFLATTE